MSDLERQLRAYAEQLDQTAPSVQELAVDAETGLAARPPHRRRSPWLSLAAAAAFVVVAVGGVALLTSGLESDEATSSTTAGTESSTAVIAEDPLVFTPALTTAGSQVPILVGGMGGDGWDYPFLEPGSVVERDGVFHMFPVGFGEDRPGEEEHSVGTGVGYATSGDGFDWEVRDLLFTEADVPFADSIGSNSVVVRGDATWVMYFGAVVDPCTEHGEHCPEYRIGRATAQSPEGPWEVDPDPILETGPEGTWDSGAVTDPSVVPVDGGYVMYYAGGDKESYGAVGIARSDDGVTWDKDAEPVFEATQPWEDGAIRRPAVLRSDDGWVMTYSGRTGGNRGVAHSDDGLGWEPYPGNPVLDGLVVELPAIFDTDLVHVDGEYRWYVANGGHRSGSSIFLLVFDGRIPPGD